jgi:nitrogen fixation/metabolism regulation signal transduction histidine kinase
MKIFQIKLIFRVVLMFFALAAFSFYVFGRPNHIRAIFAGLAVLISVGEMLHFVHRTNRSLSSFLTAIIHNDFNLRFSREEEDLSYQQLFGTFNEVSEKFGKLVEAREKEHLYLQHLISHLQVGILATDEEGAVIWMNDSIKKLLERPHLHTLKGLQQQYPGLAQMLSTLSEGQSELISLESLKGAKRLLFRCSVFRLGEEGYRLYSAQDIQGELKENEVQAWEKLLRVLTHEIMNSVTPISSLSKSLNSLLSSAPQTPIPKLQQGLDAISTRSDALLAFTDAYRQLAAIPRPQKTSLSLEKVLQRIHTLFEPQIAAQKVNMTIKVNPNNLSIQADPQLLDQVLINLIKNALDALKGESEASIQLHASKDDMGEVQLLIQDNGPGIPQDLREKIFIPFYTTKENGSGIGLSLSRQIMLKHGGNLVLDSEEGVGSTFLLQFE